MSELRPMYDLIRENLVNGALPRGFSLPWLEEGDGSSFADGAWDGIAAFHMQPVKMTEEMREMMVMGVDFMNEAYVSLAERKFAQLGQICRAIHGEDELQDYVIQNASKLSVKTLYETAMSVVKEGDRRESVKYALILLGMIRSNNDKDKEVIRTMALSDEFTYFALHSILRWDNYNEEVFKLIQKVYGWGRIFLLQALEPTTSEIKDWIFWNGIDNDVMPAYCAQTVWEKADVDGRIARGLTEKEAANIDKIAAAAMEQEEMFGGGDDDWDDEEFEE